jgi:CyaY protein
MIDEQEFRLRADEALAQLDRKLGDAAEEHDIEPDFNAGAINIDFEDPPARFVVSPNAPVRQIWISAQMTSFKLDWDSGRSEFVLPETGQSLEVLIADLIGKQLGEEVKL